jgi:hypothetical protein
LRIGANVVFTVGGEQGEPVGAIADTGTMFEGKGSA